MPKNRKEKSSLAQGIHRTRQLDRLIRKNLHPKFQNSPVYSGSSRPVFQDFRMIDVALLSFEFAPVTASFSAFAVWTRRPTTRCSALSHEFGEISEMLLVQIRSKGLVDHPIRLQLGTALNVVTIQTKRQHYIIKKFAPLKWTLQHRCQNQHDRDHHHLFL
ncbi:hypothetical protein PHBOTO_003052 [Pseudozyma hubeiensis]|nr:hypothetical protein PHBOTO_003052 [Pseudozyma hubeiensis]